MAHPLPVSGLGLLLAFGSIANAAEPSKPDRLFEPAKVWQFHIEMTAKEYEAMQPATGGGFGFPGGFPGAAPAPVPAKKPGDRETHRSVFGTDFPVAHATISNGAETVDPLQGELDLPRDGAESQALPQARHRPLREGQALPRRQARRGGCRPALSPGARRASSHGRRLSRFPHRSIGEGRGTPGRT